MQLFDSWLHYILMFLITTLCVGVVLMCVNCMLGVKSHYLSNPEKMERGSEIVSVDSTSTDSSFWFSTTDSNSSDSRLMSGVPLILLHHCPIHDNL